jgi:putative flippase GtrA
MRNGPLALLPQKVQYVASGAASFFAENAVFSLCFYALSFNYAWANILSIAVAAMVNFYLNRQFVFKNSTKQIHHQVILYGCLLIMNLVISTLLIGLLIEFMPVYAAKLTATVLVVCWTFVIYKKIIFKN